MPLVAAVCPCCGASIQIPEENERSFCAYCGNQIINQAAICFGKVQVEGTVRTKSTDFVIEAGTLKEYHGESTDVVIPDGVRTIGACVFEDTGITSVTIPNSVITIERNAFIRCESLTSVVIPDSVTAIYGWAFNGCSSLTSVKLSNSLTSIGSGAFGGCFSLTSITIPSSVTSIGPNAFGGCSSLTSITIPNSVTVVHEGAFWGCKSLASVIIPGSVTSIGDAAFRDCESLTSVIIPSSVKSIGEFAFQNCRSLTSVTILSSSASISQGAFADCNNLMYSNLHLPKGKTALSYGSHAFPLHLRQHEWQQQGLCPHCGAVLKGILFKTCPNNNCFGKR